MSAEAGHPETTSTAAGPPVLSAARAVLAEQLAAKQEWSPDSDLLPGLRYAVDLLDQHTDSEPA